jgi:hypothetical protein
MHLDNNRSQSSYVDGRSSVEIDTTLDNPRWLGSNMSPQLNYSASLHARAPSDAHWQRIRVSLNLTDPLKNQGQ